MPKLDYDEIIALSEDPNVTSDDLPPGRPMTPEERSDFDDAVDDLFYRAPLEVQVSVTECLPAELSARRLGRMPADDRNRILEQLPTRLTREIVGRLPVGAS